MMQKTAKASQDVEAWVESTPHHAAEVRDDGALVLKGYGDRLIIPAAVLKGLPKDRLVPGEPFDRRMFRWKEGRK